jgi:hypothetical protein
MESIVEDARHTDGSPVSGIDAEQLSYGGGAEGRRQCRDIFEFIKSVTPDGALD